MTTAVLGTWPVELNPLAGDQLGHFAIKRHLNRPFLEQTRGGPVCPYCEDIPSEENGALRVIKSSDGHWTTVASYHLRREAQWADGAPMTSADVAFTWDVFRHAGQKLAAFDSRVTGIRDVRVVNEQDFDVIYDGIICRDRLTAPPLLPAHLEREIWEADPERYFERTLYRVKPETPGLYSGPFRLGKVQDGSLQLYRNEHWVGHPAFFEKVVATVAPTQEGLEKLVRSRGVDVFTTYTLDSGYRLAQELATDYNAFYAPSDFLVHLRVNFDNPILADLRVRKALLFGLDRDSLVSTLLNRRGTVAQSLLSPFMAGYTPVTRYPYSPQKAAQLLDEAGWLKDRDGLRRNGSGTPLQFELRYRQKYPWTDLAPRLAAAWHALGIQVDLVVDPGLSGEAIDSRKKYPGVVGFSEWLTGGLEVARYWYHTAMIPSAANGWQGNNYLGASVPIFDEALDKLVVAGCVAANRKEALAEVQGAYAEGLPALPLWFGTVLTLSDKRLQGTVDPRTFTAAPVEDWRPRS